MIEVAKVLGVELEEEFTIPELYDNGYLYKITETGLVCRNRNREGALWQHESIALKNLLTGELAITKLPWKPKYIEGYYYPCIYEEEIFYALWVGSTLDYALFTLGMCYKTKEEAQSHFAEDYKRLTGKELE